MSEDYAFQAFMRAYYSIKNYKEKYNDGITVILGAGCSLTSSNQDITTESIVFKCLQDNYDSNYIKPNSWEQLYQDFIDKLWSHKGEQEKVDMLSHYLGYLRPSKGYQYLQKLIESGFVSNIITTNFDMMTDICCEAMDIEKWVGDKRIRKHTTSSYITLLKVHGDLENKKIRFAPDELRRLPNKIEKMIKKMTHKVVILLGWRGQDGGVLDSLDIQSDFSCYWVSPNKPSEYECMNNAAILRWMEVHNSRHNFIYGKDYGFFDEFMEKLSEKLLSSTIVIDKGHQLPKVWKNNTIIDMISVNQHIFQSFLSLLNIIDNYFQKNKWKISAPFYAKNYGDILRPCLLFFRPGQIPDFMLQIPNNETDALFLGLALELRARLSGSSILDSMVLTNIKNLYEALECRCIFDESFWNILQYLINPKVETWSYNNIVDVCFNPDNNLILHTKSIPVEDIKALLDCLQLLTFFAPTCSVLRKEESFNLIKRQLENHINSRRLLNDCIEIHINSLTENEFNILKDYLLKNMYIDETETNCLKGKWIKIYSKNVLPINANTELPLPNTLYSVVSQHANRKTNQYLDLSNVPNNLYIPLNISQILNEFKSSDYFGLFIIGSSGCGKSSTLKYFVKEESDNGNLCIPLAAFFCNLHMVQSNPFFEEIFPQINENILSELHDSCRLRNSHIFFIIDGLNEFSGTNIDVLEIYEFVIRFTKLIYKRHFNYFKVIISCRDASFFHYMTQVQITPGLNEFMNFTENDSLEPIPYYRIKALSKEEISALCNVYFGNSEDIFEFQNFIKNINGNTNLLSPFLIYIASTLSPNIFRSTRKNDLFSIFITKMFSKAGPEFNLIMTYRIFDVYFTNYLQNKYPTNYFYLVQEFDKKEQKQILNILRKLAEVNLIQYHENLMADIFKFTHDKIEEYFLLEFLKLNLHSDTIITAFELTQENEIFRESCINFVKYLFEERKQEFAVVFGKIYAECPNNLANILGSAFQLCKPSVLEGFLDEGSKNLEILQSAIYGILHSIKSYDYSVCIDNIKYLIIQGSKYLFLKSMLPFLRYIVAMYHIYLTTNYTEAERQTEMALEEMNTFILSDNDYLRHSFQIISAIVLRNKGHIHQATELLEKNNQYFLQYNQMEDFYYVTLELGSALREQTDFDKAIALYEKVDVDKIKKYPLLYHRLILQIGIIYKNKMQEVLYAFIGEKTQKEAILNCREKAIQNYEKLINLNNCKQLTLIEAKTELAETLILSSNIVESDLCIKKLLDNIRELLKNINAPHRILQFMRIEANYYETQNDINMALDILYQAKGIAKKYQLPFRIFECNYQIAHMIAHQADHCSAKLANEGIKAINAAIYFCEAEINSSNYLKECLVCREQLERIIFNYATYL